MAILFLEIPFLFGPITFSRKRVHEDERKEEDINLYFSKYRKTNLSKERLDSTVEEEEKVNETDINVFCRKKSCLIAKNVK